MKSVHVCVDFLLFIESSKVHFLHFTVHQIAGKEKRISVRTKDQNSRGKESVNMQRKRWRNLFSSNWHLHSMKGGVFDHESVIFKLFKRIVC